MSWLVLLEMMFLLKVCNMHVDGLKREGEIEVFNAQSFLFSNGSNVFMYDGLDMCLLWRYEL